jgi:hypothetical protein
VTGLFASGGYFAVLGVAAIRGRTFRLELPLDPSRGRRAGGSD